MTIRSGDFMSHKYLYNQQLTPATINNTQHPTTPKSRPSNGLPRSRFYWHLLTIAAAN